MVVFSGVLWFMLLFRIFVDVFTRDDIGGRAKAGRVVLTLVLPFLGVFTYLVSQRRAMRERSARAVERQGAASDADTRPVAADAEAEQLAKARGLLPSGAITPGELQRMVPSVHS